VSYVKSNSIDYLSGVIAQMHWFEIEDFDLKRFRKYATVKANMNHGKVQAG
jgi:hypothetical protein